MADSPESNSNGVLRVTVYANGRKLDDAIGIVSVDVGKTINKIPTARIVVLDGDMPDQEFPISDADTFKPGTKIKIDAGYDDGEDTIFQGIIVKHSVKISRDNFARLVVDCQDKAVGMTIGRKNANYVDSADDAIIKKLIGGYSGLSADVDSTAIEHREIVQYYCTDWDFLLSRAEMNGLLVIVENGKVSVKAPSVTQAPELDVAYGQDLMEFEAAVDARSQLAGVKATAWDPKKQAVVESKEATPQTLNRQGDLDSKELAKVLGLTPFRLQTPVPIEKTEADSWAEAQQVKSGLARIRGRMKFQGSAKAMIGTLIKLEGVGNRFNGDVFVSALSHDLSDGDWTTEVEFGLSPNWFAEGRDLAAPAASGMLPGAEGLQVGVVTKLDGDPSGQNKIQVAVPVLQAETEGVWARLASFYGSNGIGAFFVPEIGDEVVLGYFNNDPSHPVVLGSLYSGGRKPPYSLTADNFIKAIVTKNELKVEFDDEKKIITVVTPGGNQIVISDEGKSIVLQDQNDNMVELGPDGIVLDSPKDIKITAKGKITIDAVGAVGISSKADVKLEGLNIEAAAKVGLTAKGNASAELSASGQTTIKGAMVMIN